MIKRVVDSQHQWYVESPIPCIIELESRRLCVSPIRRVDDSAYHWVKESMTLRVSDTGSSFFSFQADLNKYFILAFWETEWRSW